MYYQQEVRMKTFVIPSLPEFRKKCKLLTWKKELCKKSNGMYIDPIFSQQQSWFWTGDKFNSNRAFVLRLPGALLVDSLLINFSYDRPVRSL